jgi:hypothetical protein
VPFVPLTVAAADNSYGVRYHSIDATFSSAFVASIFVHLTALVVIGAAGADLGAGTSVWSGTDGRLEVVLATTPIGADAQKGDIAYETARAAMIGLPAPQEPAAKVASAARETSSQRSTEAGRSGGGRTPRVIVDDNVPRARFYEALEGGALAAFPLEIESPVALPGKLAVPYPVAALDKRLEGTVLAWAIVDRQGAVEETQIIEGTPEFADAVRATLATTRFIPARDGGAPIRFYVLLEFDFRIEARGNTATNAR